MLELWLTGLKEAECDLLSCVVVVGKDVCGDEWWWLWTVEVTVTKLSLWHLQTPVLSECSVAHKLIFHIIANITKARFEVKSEKSAYSPSDLLPMIRPRTSFPDIQLQWEKYFETKKIFFIFYSFWQIFGWENQKIFNGN